jgi:hypothetical protein
LSGSDEEHIERDNREGYS